MFDEARQLIGSLVPSSTPQIVRQFDPTDAFQIVGQRAAPTRGTKELIRAFNESPWIRAVVSKIAYHFASVPWMLFVKTDANGRAVRSSTIQNAHNKQMRDRMLKQLRRDDGLRQIDNHPILDLLSFANPQMTGLNARRITQTYLDLKGELFWVIERGPMGAVQEYWPIPPHWVTDLPTDRKPTFEITSDGRSIRVPQDDVIWFRDLNPADPYKRGTGIGETLGDEIESDEYAAKHIKTWFLNKAKPEIMVSVKGISQDQAERAKEVFEREHRSFWRAHRSWWVGGDVDVKELQQSFSDMELTQLRSWERDIVVNVFGVPPEILGILTNSNRATVTESRRIFASEVLIPRLEFFRAELQAKLVPTFDDRLILDYESPEPDDDQLRLETMRAAPWAFTRGEWRSFGGVENRGDVDDVHVMPLGLTIDDDGAGGDDAPPPMDDAGDPPMDDGAASASRSLAKAKKSLTDSQIELIADAIDGDILRDQLNPIWERFTREWIEQTAEDIERDQKIVGNLGEALIAQLVADHLREFGAKRITRVNNLTRKRIRKIVADAVARGDGPPVIAREIRAAFSKMTKGRATRIARTETLRSSNFAIAESHKASGVVSQREWVSVLDGVTRDVHAGLNGQIVDIGDRFKFAGYSTDYPGNFGVADQDINCRCTTVANFSGLARSTDEYKAVWKRFDDRLLVWDGAAIDGLARAFRRQSRAVVKRLRSVAAGF